MIRILLMAALLPLCGVLTAREPVVVNARSGKTLSLGQLARELKKYDVVFFGEWHGNQAIHSAQIGLFRSMHAQDPRLIASFEMFERDVQGHLDDYLAGSISEAEFLANSRPWPNYEADYRPPVEFAREKGLAAIAANVPRRLAGRAARSGESFREELTAQDKALIAKEISAPAGKYRDRFMATMKANAMHGDADNEDLYQNLFLAQCVKDDTMAESILEQRSRQPQHRILHFNGDFHSREFLGTVERVRSRDRKLKLAVISPHPEELELPEQADKIATYFLLVPRSPDQADEE